MPNGARNKQPTPQYRLEEPETQQYIAARFDGTHGLATKEDPPLGWTTFGEAARYSSTRLHGTPHDIVRVDA